MSFDEQLSQWLEIHPDLDVTPLRRLIWTQENTANLDNETVISRMLMTWWNDSKMIVIGRDHIWYTRNGLFWEPYTNLNLPHPIQKAIQILVAPMMCQCYESVLHEYIESDQLGADEEIDNLCYSAASNLHRWLRKFRQRAVIGRLTRIFQEHYEVEMSAPNKRCLLFSDVKLSLEDTTNPVVPIRSEDFYVQHITYPYRSVVDSDLDWDSFRRSFETRLGSELARQLMYIWSCALQNPPQNWVFNLVGYTSEQFGELSRLSKELLPGYVGSLEPGLLSQRRISIDRSPYLPTLHQCKIIMVDLREVEGVPELWIPTMNAFLGISAPTVWCIMSQVDASPESPRSHAMSLIQPIGIYRSTEHAMDLETELPKEWRPRVMRKLLLETATPPA